MGLALWPRTRVAGSLATRLAETPHNACTSLKTALAAKSRRAYLLGGVDQAAQLLQEEPHLPSVSLSFRRIVPRPIGAVPLSLRPAALTAMKTANGSAAHRWSAAREFGSPTARSASWRRLGVF